MPRKISVDIERGSNKGFVVTYIKTFPTGIQKMTGIKPEVETLAFANEKELAEWIGKTDLY